MKKFCVIDSHYSDFVEAFDSLAEARIFVNGLISKAMEGELYNYAIGKYIDDVSDNYEIIDYYTNKL